MLQYFPFTADQKWLIRNSSNKFHESFWTWLKWHFQRGNIQCLLEFTFLNSKKSDLKIKSCQRSCRTSYEFFTSYKRLPMKAAFIRTNLISRFAKQKIASWEKHSKFSVAANFCIFCGNNYLNIHRSQKTDVWFFSLSVIPCKQKMQELSVKRIQISKMLSFATVTEDIKSGCLGNCELECWQKSNTNINF